MVDSVVNGDWSAARRQHYRLLPIMRACFLETNPIPIKGAMKILGRDSGEVRLPMTVLSAAEEQKLLDAFYKK